MRLQPIIYTASMNRAVDWYSKVLNDDPVYRSDVWTSFAVGDATLGIHRANTTSEVSRMELSLVADSQLEDVVANLNAHSISIERGIQEETFGRSLVIRDPDGSLIQVNEHQNWRTNSRT